MQAKPQLVSTKYQKSIKSPFDYKLLKPGSNNAKLGFKVTAKKWTGKRLYSLTLVERETCPQSCHHWDDCYGNNMPFAHRFSSENLTNKLAIELEQLNEQHPKGIVVRLHVLGDFYSVPYVEFWENSLLRYQHLSIFGYTARDEQSQIGKRIWIMNNRFNERCVIRHSGEPKHTTWRYAVEEKSKAKSFVCPEQIGKLPSCAACGLCWISSKAVKFLTH